MTIRKQLILLSSIIIAIPIICLLFVAILFYKNSTKRFLINGTQQIDEIPSEIDAQILKRTIRQMPPDIQLIIYSPQFDKIYYSSIPEIPADSRHNTENLWHIINRTSDCYFYQFSSPPFRETQILVITRIPRQKQSNFQRHKLYTVSYTVLLLSTVISLILITLISKTIFYSIKSIEDKTQRLADGKLNEKIEPEEKNRGNEITSILKSLEKMRTELIEDQKRRNRFIMGISHDLRTPVAVIKGYSEAITDDVITDKEEIKNTVKLIDTKAAQLGQMIDTLINFMKLNSTEAKQALIPQSITELITEFAKYAEVTGTVFKRKIKTSINFDQNITVPLNSQLVQRSLENLFSNAIRYTDNGDLIEIISYIEQTENSKAVILKVKDHGIGIDEKDLHHIFDMFFRGTNSRLEEGMGIGLSVVKTIIDTHGWKISVDSVKNEGTCFTITIPAEKKEI